MCVNRSKGKKLFLPVSLESDMQNLQRRPVLMWFLEWNLRGKWILEIHNNKKEIIKPAIQNS